MLPTRNPVYPQQTTLQNSKREEDSYAVSKAVHHRVQGPGRLRRVTAAILINDRMVRSADGKHVTWVARTPAEMHEIQQLAQAAVGIDAARGDQLTVQNLAFATNANPTSSGLATRLIDHVGDSMGFVRYGVLFAVFLMVLIFIVRPVLAQIKQLSSSVQTMSAAGGQAPQLKSASGAAQPRSDGGVEFRASAGAGAGSVRPCFGLRKERAAARHAAVAELGPLVAQVLMSCGA